MEKPIMQEETLSTSTHHNSNTTDEQQQQISSSLEKEKNEGEEFLNLRDYDSENKPMITHTNKQINDDKTNINNGNMDEEITQHHVISFFTLAFKAASVGIYTFGTWFTNNFVLVFVITILILACDFWVVKNVSGRFLVGLRWWNEVMEDGRTQWRFESSVKDSRSKKEWRIFWYSLVLTPLVWGLFALLSLIKLDFQWLILTFFALALNGAQLWGYWQCSREPQKVINEWQTGITLISTNFMQSQT